MLLGTLLPLLLAPLIAAAPQTTTEWLRSEAGSDWTSITTDPFVSQLADGTITNATLTRYLVQDHKFVDAFMVLLASMVAHAPSLVDRVPGAKFLGLIAGDENSYFLRSFEALGLSKAEINAPPAPVTKRFDALMRTAAAGGQLHEMLAVLVVAEWSYLTWGEAAKPAANLSWLHLEWIDLHRGDYFASVISYLRGQLDKLELSSTQRAEARAAFLEAIACEKEFWEMARGGGGGEL
jgi:thiaminase/transcriptional activator TenA